MCMCDALTSSLNGDANLHIRSIEIKFVICTHLGGVHINKSVQKSCNNIYYICHFICFGINHQKVGDCKCNQPLEGFGD
jgi:hypothetical protein